MLPALRPRRRLPLALLGRLLSSSSTAGEGGPPADAAAAAAAKAQEAAAALQKAYKEVGEFDWATGADWKKAAKIFSTVPAKRKEFGLDFHLVQLFFVCMPSLAVYLVAQYARKEIRRMEAEAEEKRKKDEELEKEKQLEADAIKEDAELKLSRALVRLDTLEGVVKEIVDDKRKSYSPGVSTKEEVPKKDETPSPDKASDSESNVSDSQPGAAKSKDINGVTHSLSNTTQWNTRGNGNKASGEPKT